MTPPPSSLANAAGSLRQEMTAASSICLISPTRCQARTRLYRDGRLELEGFPVADISDHLSDGSVTIWLDLRDPDHRHFADWAGALPHLQTQGLAVRPKILPEAGQLAAIITSPAGCGGR